MLLLFALEVDPYSIGLGVKDLYHCWAWFHSLPLLEASLPFLFLLLLGFLSHLLHQTVDGHGGNHPSSELLYSTDHLAKRHLGRQPHYAFGDPRSGYLPLVPPQMFIQQEVVLTLRITVQMAAHSNLAKAGHQGTFSPSLYLPFTRPLLI
jgi:hypothetical protein